MMPHSVCRHASIIYTKMSKDFTHHNNNNNNQSIKLNDNDFPTTQSTQNVDDLLIDTYEDHLYATNNAEHHNNTESEVKFLREWLILHLDLIQQQNDEIIEKERTILILQQENEMLKERISCMEKGANYPGEDTQIFEDNETKEDGMTHELDEAEEEEEDEDETEDVAEDNDKKNVNFFAENGDATTTELNRTEEVFDEGHIKKEAEELEEEEEETPTKSEQNNSASDGVYGFTIDTNDFDPMRNLRMSIRRKRVCSNSSVLSTNESLEEKRNFRKFKKKRRRTLKDSQILTTPDQYVTHAGDITHPDSNTDEFTTNLEVPRWRVKLYASCYTMEGTENLDDEVYNKRHSRLENDERRRKRWDVQRIREQRVIEKLKQRQERVGSNGGNAIGNGGGGDEPHTSITSFWPKCDDIKYLEIVEHLPVSAFGIAIPKVTASEFSLPWITNPNVLTIRKIPTKRSIVRRKNTKR